MPTTAHCIIDSRIAVMEEAAAAAIGADERRLSDEELREEITYWAQWEAASSATEEQAVVQLLAVLRYELSGRASVYPPENPKPISEAEAWGSCEPYREPGASCYVCGADTGYHTMEPVLCDKCRPASETPASPSTSTPSAPSRYSFTQVRAKLANAARAHFTQEELMTRLRAAGVAGQLPSTRRALAMRYAWALLPGGLERAKGGRS